MGRVWQCGFELGSLATAVEITTSSGALTVQSTVARPASGTFALRVNPTNSTGFARYHVHGSDQAAAGYQRFALRIDTVPSASTTICRFLDTGNNPAGQIRLTSAGRLQLWTASGAQIGADSGVLTSGDGSWHVIEIGTDATGAGALEARLNQTSFASGANSAQGSWSRLLIGIIGTNATADLYFDDWALNDASGSAQNSWPGDGHIIHRRPASAGDANAWNITNNTAGGVNNYTLVDEATPNDTTDLVQSGTLNAEDMYAVGASGIGAATTVNAVLVGWRGRNNTADAATTARLQIKKAPSGTITQGSNITPNSASFATNVHAEPRNYTLITHLNPDGAAWTQSLLDSMQIGVKITSAGVNRVQLTTIWASVDYTPSTGGTTEPLDPAGDTEAAGPLGRRRQLPTAPAESAETAQALGRRKHQTAGTAQAVEAAQPLGQIKQRPLGTATETGTARPAARRKQLAARTATETDQARDLGTAHAAALASAAETGAARPLGRAKLRQPGPASEQDTAQPVGRVKRRPLGTAVEAGSAQPLARTKQRPAGPAAEAETAEAAGPPNGIVLPPGTGAETESALPLARSKRRPSTPAADSDAAQPIGRVKRRPLGTAAETVSAGPINRHKARPVGAAVETETTPHAGRSKRRVLAHSGEAAASRPLARRKSRALAAAAENEQARPLSITGAPAAGRGDPVLAAHPGATLADRPEPAFSAYGSEAVLR